MGSVSTLAGQVDLDAYDSPAPRVEHWVPGRPSAPGEAGSCQIRSAVSGVGSERTLLRSTRSRTAFDPLPLPTLGSIRDVDG